jgi:hypothetical protein
MRVLLAGVLALGAVSLPVNGYAQPDKVAYELQERCGKRAAEVHALHFPDAGNTSEAFHYVNHYNSRLNKCFLVEGDPTLGKIRIYILTDINENRAYGTFDPITCKVDNKNCRTHSLAAQSTVD